MEDLRSSTPKMPVSEAGATVTDFFCDTAEPRRGRELSGEPVLAPHDQPRPRRITVVPLRRTRWRPADPIPLQERASQPAGGVDPPGNMR